MGSIAVDLPSGHDFDVAHILSQLSIDEKVSLISGSDPWHTAPIPRFGIPAIRLTDGPNGVRGTKFFNGVPAACLPCGKREFSSLEVRCAEVY
jgi:beta-glucosidase